MARSDEARRDQFAPSLIHHLSDSSDPKDGSAPSSQRQATLDAHIRERIQRELAQLRADEAEIRAQVQRTLEKENIEREKQEAPEGGLDSREVQKELDALRGKVERARRKRDGIDERVAPKRQAVVECYKCVSLLWSRSFA